MINKKLYRPRDDRWVAGVLSGFARYFGHDSTIWRLAFIIFLVMTGFMPGILIYVIAWIIMPNDDGVHYEVR